MTISLIPWEAIWLADLFVLVVWVIGLNLVVSRGKKFTVPHHPLFYTTLVLLVGIPFALNVLHVRFDVAATNDAATTFKNSSVDLRPHRYDVPPQKIYDAAVKVVQTQKTYGQPWTITFADYMDDQQLGRVVVEIPVLFWIDDFSITIQPIGGDAADYRVDVYSASRTGEADLGENARHIKQFFRALDRELANQK